MSFFTVSFFGHRELEDLRQVEALLLPLLRKLIKEKEFVTFLIGRNGGFDEYTASLIKGVRRQLDENNSELVLVLPYKVANLEYYEDYYDSIILPASLHGVHPKSAITLKNRWMIDHSDLVVVFVERHKGGAYAAMQYAKKKNKSVINLAQKGGDEEP